MAYGMFAGGTGTPIDPYLIEDAADLDAIRRNPTVCYKLINNINLGVPPYCVGKGWQPINGFTGKFDGNGKKIINMYINRPDEDGVGFIGTTGAMTIQQYYAISVKNVGFENAYVKGRSQVGIIIGIFTKTATTTEAYTATSLDSQPVIGCYATGTAEGTNYVGGIIGYAYVNWAMGSFIAASNCMAAVKIIAAAGAGTDFGGILGSNPGHSTGWQYYIDCSVRAHRCVSLCTFSLISGVKTFATISPTSGCTESFHDDTLVRANGASVQITSGSTPITTEEFFNLSSKIVQLKDQLLDGVNLYRFKHGNYPSFWFANQDCYFVRAGINYYTYDTDAKKWIKQFDVIPSTTELLKIGMQSLHQIDTNAWNQLKQYGKVDLINYVEPREKLSVSYAREDLPLQTNQQVDTKLCYSREILFADFNNDIVSVAP
jgi:hypothetical protein